MIEVIGAKGKIESVDAVLKELEKLSKENGVILQALNADLICGKEHVISAALHAVRAFREKRNKANTLSIEILLYASGERQIGEAIEKMGIKEGETRIAIAAVHSIPEATGKIDHKKLEKFIKKLGLKRDDAVLEWDEEKLKKFGITEEEMRTVSEDKRKDLVLERVAMVDVMK
ncbi:MAG: hypothetical protein J7L20_05060 [Thermoplasmata archaeon]|nr:hypothetical protein [Thermoplasmata archaeon]